MVRRDHARRLARKPTCSNVLIPARERARTRAPDHPITLDPLTVARCQSGRIGAAPPQMAHSARSGASTQARCRTQINEGIPAVRRTPIIGSRLEFEGLGDFCRRSPPLVELTTSVGCVGELDGQDGAVVIEQIEAQRIVGYDAVSQMGWAGSG